MPIRIIKHEAVPQTGSFEVRFPTVGPASTSIGTTFLGAGSGRKRWIAQLRWRRRRLSLGLLGLAWERAVAKCVLCGAGLSPPGALE